MKCYLIRIFIKIVFNPPQPTIPIEYIVEVDVATPPGTAWSNEFQERTGMFKKDTRNIRTGRESKAKAVSSKFKESTNSKCTAGTTAHINNKMYFFESPESVQYNGPAWSRPQTENGALGWIQSVDNGGGRGVSNAVSCLKQLMQLLRILWANRRTP